ncbi:MAG: glutamate-cysteine ligase family protein [Saprospiraceae bacterium]
MKYEQIFNEFIKKFSKNDKHCTQRGIGIELEIPIVSMKGEVVDLSIIQEMFSFFESEGFELKRDSFSNHIISASRVNVQSAANFDYVMDTVMTDAGSSIIEVVFAPQDNLHTIQQSLSEIIDLLTTYLDTQNCKMLGYGIQPVTPPSRKLLMPKERYFFYEKFSPNHIIPKSEGADAHLLTISASNQCHISISQKDTITAVNVLNALSGLQIIFNANSPIWKGEIDRTYKANREAFWEHCYPDRLNQMGIPPKFDTLDDYLLYLLDFKPMLVKREKLLQVLNKTTFKDFMLDQTPTIGQTLEGEKCSIQPKVEDIHYLNTFCYFNARLAPQFGTIESRMCCQQPPDAAIAPTALTLGLLSNLEEANRLTEIYPRETWKKIREMGLQHTFSTTINGKKIIPLLTQFLEVAKQGLEKRDLGEEVFLNPYYRRLNLKQSPADKAIEIFEEQGISGLLKHFSFKNQAKQSSLETVHLQNN